MKITVPESQRQFERLLKRGSLHTRRAYTTDVQQFADWLKAELPAAGLYALLRAGRVGARELVERYAASLIRGSAHSTIARRVSTLKSFVSVAFASGLVDWKLEVDLPKPKTVEGKKAAMKRDMAGPKQDAFDAVIAHLAGELDDPALRPNALRDRAIIALLENPMLRRSEVAQLNIDDMELSRGAEEVTVLGKARDLPEKLPLPPKTAAYLREWINFRGGKGSDAVFTRIRNTFGGGPQVHGKERLSVSGIYAMTIARGRAALGKKSKRLNPHALRHTGITQLANHIAKKGIPVAAGMKVSRHKKAETFWSYVDHQDEEKRKLVTAIER